MATTPGFNTIPTAITSSPTEGVTPLPGQPGYVPPTIPTQTAAPGTPGYIYYNPTTGQPQPDQAAAAATQASNAPNAWTGPGGSQFSTTNPNATPTTAGAPAGGYSFQVPAGINASDPVDALVLQQFQQAATDGMTDAGSQPTAANMQYWIDQINATGGATPSNLAYWSAKMTAGEGSGGAPSSGAGAAGGAGAYVPGQGVPGQGTVFGPNNPNTGAVTALEAQLMGLAQQYSQPVTAQDPIIAAQTGAFNAQEQQAARNYETQAAETAGPSANEDAVARSQAENVGQQTGAFEATAMSNELTQRMSALQNILTQYGSTLTQEQQMQLTEELNQLALAQQAYTGDTLNAATNVPTAA